MESTADVHELLTQYAEEIRSVGPWNWFIPLSIDSFQGKRRTAARRRRGQTVRRTEFLRQSRPHGHGNRPTLRQLGIGGTPREA